MSLTATVFLADWHLFMKTEQLSTFGWKIPEDLWLPNENQILGLYGNPRHRLTLEEGGWWWTFFPHSQIPLWATWSVSQPSHSLGCTVWLQSLALDLTFYSNWTLERQGHLCWAIQLPFPSLTLWVSLLFEWPQWRSSFWTPAPLDSDKSPVLFLPFELDNRKADIQCGAM